MTVLQIVQEYLEAHGLDGLYCAGECACQKSDLAPCKEKFDDCEAGYLVPCPPECGEHLFHIGPDKPVVTPSAASPKP